MELPIADDLDGVAGADDVETRDRDGKRTGELGQKGNLATQPFGHLRAAGEAEDPVVVDLDDRAVPPLLDRDETLDAEVGSVSLDERAVVGGGRIAHRNVLYHGRPCAATTSRRSAAR